MLIPRFIVSVEWMRYAFRAFDIKINEHIEALPTAISKIIHNSPTEVEKLKDWIAEVCKICGVKPSNLAREAGLSPSTINRFLKNEGSKASLNANTISSLERAGEKLVRKRIDEKPWVLSDIADEDENESDQKLRNLYHNNLVEVPVMGLLGINSPWMLDTFQELAIEEYKVVIPAPKKYADKFLFGFTLWDVRKYPADSRTDDIENLPETIICVPTWFDGVKLSGCERVIIVKRPHDETIELGIRDLTKDNRGNIWLMPLDNEVGIVEPAFMGRDIVPLVKDKIGIALIVVGTYRNLE